MLPDPHPIEALTDLNPIEAAVAIRTWSDVVNSVAYDFGLWFTDYEAIDLLWEYTGYPSFFMGDPATTAAEQLRTLFTERVGTS